MKKFITFMAFTLMAVFSLSLVSCGGDDEEKDVNPSAGESQIEINGVKHYVGGIGAYFLGSFTMVYDEGICAINMHVNDGRTDNVYQFMYVAGHAPKVGDELSKMKNFTVTAFNFYDEYEEKELSYSSGTAKVTAINTSVDDGSVTIKFDNLKMVSGRLSLTFNGTAIIPFNFD